MALNNKSTQNLDLNGNDIINVDTVDSRDVSVDGTRLDAITDANYKNSNVDLSGKANVSHTHPTTDLTATGGTATSFLRRDNTWQTPTNTTYAEITDAEIATGTASTARAISGRRAQTIAQKAIDASAAAITAERTATATLSNKTLVSPAVTGDLTASGDIYSNGVKVATQSPIPAFMANKTSGGTMSSNNYVPFTGYATPEYDNLDNFNASTGVFTAPVAGIYSFTMSIYSNSGNRMGIMPLINGSTVGKVANGTLYVVAGTRQVQLDVGGTIQMQGYSYSAASTFIGEVGSTFFSAYLVSSV